MPSWVVSEDILHEHHVVVRDATRDDVAAIVGLFRTDELSRKHKAGETDAVEDGYYASFDAIAADQRNRLLVATMGDEVVGSFQLTFVPDMRPDAREIAIVENVVVHATSRNAGIGSVMMRWAIAEARARNCSEVKLTSGKPRSDAHRFYGRLGFEATHEGFRLLL